MSKKCHTTRIASQFRGVLGAPDDAQSGTVTFWTGLADEDGQDSLVGGVFCHLNMGEMSKSPLSKGG